MFALLAPYTLYIRIALVVLALCSATLFGWKLKAASIAEQQRQLAEAALQERIALEKERDDALTRLNSRSAQLETTRQQLRQSREKAQDAVRQIESRPVYSVHCIDDDGLRLINENIRSTAPAASAPTSQPESAVPTGLGAIWERWTSHPYLGASSPK